MVPLFSFSVKYEEAVGRVAPKLLHQAELPVEIGLHRAGIDVGTFIRTPVAL